MQSNLRLYHQLSRLPLPRTYLGKFLFTAFVGVHVPLICVIGYVAATGSGWASNLPIVGVTLGATLVGTLATLWVQGRLLAPVLGASHALEAYVRHRQLPALPVSYGDEAGLLLRNTQHCVAHLDELLRLKNNLLAVVSHDGRAPLANISLANQMSGIALQDATPDVEELREMQQIIQESAERQVSLMSNLLTLAQSDAGTLRSEPTEAPLAGLLARVVSGHRLVAEQKGVELRLDRQADTGGTVRLDLSKTEQILTNLITNAVKFTPRGGTVEVGARGAGADLILHVQDTGRGMDAATVGRLFHAFSEAHSRGTDDEPGFGLGLWICKTFTELQGGSIGVESAPGAGSRFTVCLPGTRVPQPVPA